MRHPETVSTLYSLIQNKYYLWPKPYSDLAKEVLGMLSIEQKTPGAAMRHRLIREVPSIIGGSPTGKFVFFPLRECVIWGKGKELTKRMKREGGSRVV